MYFCVIQTKCILEKFFVQIKSASYSEHGKYYPCIAYSANFEE